jgi:L-ascorbate metabolism protein UlaG (beta-lactamase superfamily)
MKEIRDIDIAIVPIGGTFTMDINEAFHAILSIKPKFVIPVHYLKCDPFSYKRRFEEKSDINVIVLNIGEEFVI